MLKIKTKQPKNKTVVITAASCFVFAAVITVVVFVLVNRGGGVGTVDVDGSDDGSYSSVSKKYGSKSNSGRPSDETKKDDEPEKSEEEKSKDEKSEEQSTNDEHDSKPDKSENTTKNEDVITVQNNIREEEIAFGIETINETNLPRGETRLSRTGVNGRRRIISRVTYKNGQLISSEDISSEVIAEPVNQITLVGIADYNLNNSYIQLYPNASVTREGRNAPAVMILVNGNYYIDFWYDPVTWKRYVPASAFAVGGGSFSYDGNDYTYIAGPLDNSYVLSAGFCSEYRLTCGRW